MHDSSLYGAIARVDISPRVVGWQWDLRGRAEDAKVLDRYGSLGGMK